MPKSVLTNLNAVKGVSKFDIYFDDPKNQLYNAFNGAVRNEIISTLEKYGYDVK